MAGIVILSAILRHDLPHLVDRRHMMSKGKELTPFLGIVSLAYAISDGQKLVGTHDSL